VPPWLSNLPIKQKSTVHADFLGKASFTHRDTDTTRLGVVSISVTLITVVFPVRASGSLAAFDRTTPWTIPHLYMYRRLSAWRLSEHYFDVYYSRSTLFFIELFLTN
jgi:hypothetical protein